MRGWFLLVLLTACRLDHGAASTDAPIDTPIPPDDMQGVMWQVDAMSGKGVPATPKEWADLLAAAGLATSPPSHLWLMQETGGSLQDSIADVTLGALGSPTYSNTVAGWARKAVGTTDTSANQGFSSTAVGNLNGTSHLLLVYVALAGSPGGTRSVVALGANADHRYAAVTTQPVFQANGVNVIATTGSINPGMTVHPLLLAVDYTNQHYVVYTDQEKLESQWSAPTGVGGLAIIGNASPGAAPARYLYGALWTGAGAELGDTRIKLLLQRLGWTVTGY